MTESKAVEITDVMFKVGPTGFMPTKGTTLSAGYDLYSPIDFEIPPYGRLTVPIDVKCAMPADVYGRNAPRSGLAHKDGIDVMAGVIDCDYRDSIGVILHNTGSTTPTKQDILVWRVKRGDRIAQIIFEIIHTAPAIECKGDLPPAPTRAGGFGSTGK